MLVFYGSEKVAISLFSKGLPVSNTANCIIISNKYACIITPVWISVSVAQIFLIITNILQLNIFMSPLISIFSIIISSSIFAIPSIVLMYSKWEKNFDLSKFSVSKEKSRSISAFHASSSASLTVCAIVSIYLLRPMIVMPLYALAIFSITYFLFVVRSIYYSKNILLKLQYPIL